MEKRTKQHTYPLWICNIIGNNRDQRLAIITVFVLRYVVDGVLFHFCCMCVRVCECYASDRPVSSLNVGNSRIITLMWNGEFHIIRIMLLNWVFFFVQLLIIRPYGIVVWANRIQNTSKLFMQFFLNCWVFLSVSYEYNNFKFSMFSIFSLMFSPTFHTWFEMCMKYEMHDYYFYQWFGILSLLKRAMHNAITILPNRLQTHSYSIRWCYSSIVE